MKRLVVLALMLVVGVTSVLSQDPGYQLLDVDGIRIQIEEIRFDRDYANSTTSGSIEVGQEVELTGDLNDVFSGGVSLRLEFGEANLSYDHIKIWITSEVDIKGHTYLPVAGTHIYTTASGISSYTGGAWAAPADYDYLPKDYLYYEGEEASENETTFLSEVVAYDPTAGLDISLLVDTYQVAYYWDGEESSRHGFVKSWNQENGTYFPTGTPVIGISYLPLYVSVNQSLTAETYIVAQDAAELSPSTFFDQKNSMTMTLVFDAGTDDFFIGRTANWDYLDMSLRLPQFVTGATGTSTYDLTLQSYQDGWTNDSTITGFTRLSVGATGSATFTDSGGTDTTMHYKRVK